MQMLRFSFLLVIAVFYTVSHTCYGQEGADDETVDAACLSKPQNKKVLKLFQNSKDRNKTYKERYKMLKDALEIDEDCGACLWSLGKMNFFKAKVEGGEYFDHAIKYYSALSELCPDWHADVYYNLGIIYYNKTNDEKAKKYFQRFLDFPTDNEDKLGRNYSQQIEDVNAVLPEIDFYLEFYGNPVPFNPVLVASVSTDKEEFLPMISPDNELLMFTRRFDYKGKGELITRTIEELTLSNRSLTNKRWGEGVKMKSPFNTIQYDKYGGVSLSIDNNELYVCACQRQGGLLNCDLFFTHYEEYYDSINKKTAFQWAELQNLGPNINGPQSWEAQPSISADGNTLYFASARGDCYKNSRGQFTMDLYYSERQSDGSWGRAKNMGPTINSEGHEKAPFMHSDSRTLYYVATTGKHRLGAGGYDIYYTRQDETSGKWSTPKNLGYPINSDGDEEGLIVSIDGKEAYFSSSRSGGMGKKDIYSFVLPEDARPDVVALFKAEVKDVNGDAVEDVDVELTFKDENGKTKTIKAASKVDGNGKMTAVINLGKKEAPKDVLLSVKKEGHSFASKLIKADDVIHADKAPVIEAKTMKVAELEVGDSYTIEDVLYQSNSAELMSESIIVLEGFAQYLLQNASIEIEIQGHTDDVGNDDNNLALSKDRAFTVLEFLLGKGIKASRLSFKGFGESSPKAPNDSIVNRAKNRRTDFKIVSF